MIKVTTNVAELTAHLKRMEQRISLMPNKFALLIKGRQGRIALRAIARLGRVPGPPIYPIRWKSDRQRMAFFASKGFGRGIPTKRRNIIIKSWTAEVDASPYSGVISLSNANKEWVFIQGPYVQPFHLDTGYVQLQDVKEDFYKETGMVVVDTWKEAADPFSD